MRQRKLDDLKIADLRLYMNTDTVDIGLKQIGIHTNQGRPNRGLCIGIRHNGGSQDFRDANTIARLLVTAPEMYKYIENAIEWAESGKVPDQLAINSMKYLLAQARGEK